MEMGQSYKALSVDKKIEADSDGSTVSILDLIGDQDDGFEQTDLRLVLEKILPILTEREQKIIQYTYFENMSQKEAGARINISQMHVSRIRSEEHTSELQSRGHLVCRLLLEKKKHT